MKKLISILLLAALLLSGCSMQSAESAPVEPSAVPIAENPAETDSAEVSSALATESGAANEELYMEEYYPFPEGVSAEGIARIDSTLFMYCTSKGEEYFAMADYSVDDTGRAHIGEARIIELDEPENIAEKNIYAICAGADGCFYAVTGETAALYMDGMEIRENPDYQGRYMLLKFSKDGELLDKKELSLPEFQHILGIVVDKSGRVMLYGAGKLLCLDTDGTSRTTELEYEGTLANGTIFGEQVLFEARYENYHIANEHLLYSPETGEFSPVNLQIESGSGIEPCPIELTNIQGLHGEYVLSDELSYYCCEPGENVCHELFRWYYGTYEHISPYACRLSEKSVIRSIQGENFFLICGMAQTLDTERSAVKVALYGESAIGAENRFVVLNSRQSEYEYKTEKYNNDELERLLAGLASDTPPDLVLFQSMRGDFYLPTDDFEDLYPYIDADGELSRERFIPNYLDALTVKGELHELWPVVSVNTLAVRASELGGGSIADVDEYTAILQTHMPDEVYLQYMATLGTSFFLDKDSGTCSFDSPAFAEMLSWYNSSGDSGGGSGGDKLRLTFETVDDARRMEWIGEPFGEPYVFSGFPLAGGGGSFYSNIGQYSMAIPKVSRNKDAAWVFIRGELTESAQQRIVWGLTVNYAVCKSKAEEMCTADETALLMQLLNDTKYAENYGDSALREIIIDCGQDYLSGKTSLEKTVKHIQQRAGEYLEEQYS